LYCCPQQAVENQLLVRLSTCPNCESSVPNEPSAKEFAEMANDGRVRLIKALKVSYWKQFEHGMLSREAVQALINLADTTMDEQERYKQTEQFFNLIKQAVVDLALTLTLFFRLRLLT